MKIEKAKKKNKTHWERPWMPLLWETLSSLATDCPTEKQNLPAKCQIKGQLHRKMFFPRWPGSPSGSTRWLLCLGTLLCYCVSVCVCVRKNNFSATAVGQFELQSSCWSGPGVANGKSMLFIVSSDKLACPTMDGWNVLRLNSRTQVTFFCFSSPRDFSASRSHSSSSTTSSVTSPSSSPLLPACFSRAPLNARSLTDTWHTGVLPLVFSERVFRFSRFPIMCKNGKW